MPGQNKQHAMKSTAILQVMPTWRGYIFATYTKVIWYHINIFGYINTYLFIKHTREKSKRSRICWQNLGIIFSQLPFRYQKWRK